QGCAPPAALSCTGTPRPGDGTVPLHSGQGHGRDAALGRSGAAQPWMDRPSEGDRAFAHRCGETIGGPSRHDGGAAMSLFSRICFAWVLLACSAYADNSATPPRLPGRVDIQQKLNTQIPLDLMFRDESGKVIRLGDELRGKPVLLN